MPNSRKKLYDAISTEYNIGSFDDFNTKMNNSESRKKLYNNVSQSFDLGSFDDFESKISSKKKVVSNPTLPNQSSGSVGKVTSSASSKSNSPITKVADTLNVSFEQKSTKPKTVEQKIPKDIPTSSNNTWGKNLVSTLDSAPSVFEEYQQAKSLTSDEKHSVKQDLDDEINNEGIMNNITNLAKNWWNGVFSQEPALEIEKNPLAKNLQQIQKQFGNKVTPQEATKMAYDMELEKRSATLSESKERSYLKQAQDQGKIPALKKEQIKVYDERSKEYSNAYLKDGALKNGLEKQSESLLKLKKDIESLDPSSPIYKEKINSFNQLTQQYQTTFNEYEKNNVSLKSLGSEVSGFEHNLDMMKRDYGYWSNFTHSISNAFGDAGKGYVTTAVEAPIDIAIGALGDNSPEILKSAKSKLEETRVNYEANRDFRSDKQAKPLQVDDIKSPQDFGAWGLNMLASQSYNLLAAGTGGTAGLIGIGVNSGGQKRADMLGEMERGEADYNTLQQFLVPTLSGGSEMVGGLVDRFNLRSAGAIVKSATSSERTLIAKGMASEFAKNYVKGTVAEVTEETGVQIFQNILDIAVLNKKGINPLDGVKEAAVGALFLTSAIQGTGGLTGMAIKGLKPFSYDNRISEINKGIISLERQLEHGNLDETATKITTEQIEKLKSKSKEVLSAKIKNIESLSNESFQEVLDIEKKQVEFKEQADIVKNNNSIDTDAKETILKGLKEDFDNIEQRRIALLKKEVIAEPLIENTNQNAQTTEETTTEQKEADNSIIEENDTINNIEQNEQADLDFLESIDDSNINDKEQEIEPVKSEISNTEENNTPIEQESVSNTNFVVIEPKIKEVRATDNAESYNVTTDNNMIVFKDKNGKQPSAPTKRKLQKNYVEKNDFTQGKIADESHMETEANMNQVIAKHSENPLQIAEAILYINNTDYDNDLDYKQRGISEFIGKVERSSFLRFGDKNYLNQSIGKNFIAKKGKGQQIDTLAQEISEVYGIEVSEQDVIDFIVENPAGVSSFRNRQKGQDLYALKLKFEQLTGLPATDTVLNAVNNSNQKKFENNNVSFIDFLSNEELNNLYNEQQQSESEMVASVQSNDEGKSSRNGEQGSKTSTEDRGINERQNREADRRTGLDLATDEELQALVDEKNIYDKVITWLEDQEKNIDRFGREHLSMGLPLVLAKSAIKVMKAAAITTKKADEIIRAGLNHIKESEWYKNLDKADQKKINLSNFKQLVAESIRQSIKSEIVIEDLKNEISDLRQKLIDGKIEAKSISEIIKKYIQSNKINGKITPTEINRLIMYANNIATSNNKVKALDDFINTYNKVSQKAFDRTVKISDRQRVENRIKKELEKGKSEQEIINNFKENSSDQAIAEDYFERSKQRTDDEIRSKMKQMVDDYYAEKYIKKSSSERINNAYIKFVESLFDRAYSVKKAFNKAGMRYSTALYIATKGAPGHASYLYDKAFNEIFEGLTLEQTDNLNLIIRLRRIIAIETDQESKQRDPMVHTLNMNLNQAEQGLKVLENDIGPNEFNIIKDKADKFFKQQRELLKMLYDNGIVSEDFYNEMKDVEYIKTSYLDILNDMENNSFNVARGASTESGIVSLSNGWNGVVNMNANELLAQSIQTTTKAIFSNRLNANLISEYNKNKEKVDSLKEKSSNTNSEDQVIKDFKNVDGKIIEASSLSQKNPHGYSKVTYFENGEKKAFFMKDDFYNVYSDNLGSIWGGDWKEKVTIASGNKIVKTIATGQNPTFVITNTPRDFLWILHTSDQYSNNIAIGSYQLLKDTFKGSMDVKNDKISYQKAVEYGLMMDFLHLQGKLHFDVNPRSIIGKISALTKGNYNPLKAITYLWEKGLVLGKYSEIGFRMAVFNRSSKNLLKQFNKDNKTNFKTIEEIDDVNFPNAKDKIYTFAVQEARLSTVDFNQGGHLSKDIEALIPYFNAATQGTRMLVEKVAENPKNFTLRLIQSSSVISGMGIGLSLLILESLKDDDDERDTIELYNEFYAGVSKFDRANYFVLPIGKKDGEYQYTRIALPQALTPFFAITRGITHDFINKQKGIETKSYTFDDTSFALDKNLSPVDLSTDPFKLVGGNVAKIPIVKSVMSYLTGYDFFREQQVSVKHGKVDPIAEGFESKSVEGFYKEFGSTFGISPARAKVATEALITTPSTNVGIGVAYGSLNLMFSKDKNDKSFSDVALKSFGGRVVKETSEFNRKISNTDKFKDKKANQDVSNTKLDYEAKIIVDSYHAKEISKAEAILEFTEIYGDNKRKIKNFKDRLSKDYTKYSSDAQEIKFASTENKALLLKEHFEGNLYKESELTPKQKKLKQELIKLKALSPSTKEAYKLQIK